MNQLKEWIAVLEAGSPLTSDELKVIIKTKMNPEAKARIIKKHYKNLSVHLPKPKKKRVLQSKMKY